MTAKIAACLGSLVCAVACSTAAPPANRSAPAVPVEVFLIRSYGDHRVIITRVCNPAHCYTRGYLETLSQEEPSRVLKSVPITELEHHWWSFVREVTPSEYPDDYFDIIAEDTHGTDAGFTMRLFPADNGTYTSEMLEFRSGADP